MTRTKTKTKTSQRELVDRVYYELTLTEGVPRRTIDLVIDEVVRELTLALTRGESVALTGFGVFEPVRRPARRGHNPATGEPVEIPAGRRVKFRALTGLKRALARVADDE